MTDNFSFLRRETALRLAAMEGAFAAAELLARALQAQGHDAQISTGRNGVVSVSLEGASAVAREFGTRTQAARPVMGPALLEGRARMIETMAYAMSHAVRQGPQ